MVKTMYTEEQLAQAFGMVLLHNGKYKRKVLDWEAPIRIVIDHPGAENVNCAQEAITYFTGAIPVIEEFTCNCHEQTVRKVRITSSGHNALED